MFGKIQVVLAAVLTMAAGAPATAAQRPSDPVRTAAMVALRQLVADGNPAALGYLRIGDRQWRLAAGTADRSTGAPATPGDRFRIASNTKAFVATVVLQLVGEGRLSLDDPVSRRLPGLADRVTVRELLDHTSGIPDPTEDSHFFDPYFVRHDWGYVYRPRDVITLALREPPAFPPGTGYRYSNTNYLLAGLVIEAVTGHSAVSEIQHRLIGPLGLRDTSFPVTDPHIHGRHLHGYDKSYTDVSTFSPSYDWTAGAMISTTADLATFYRALYGGRLLAPAQQRALGTTVPEPDAPIAAGLGVFRMTLTCSDGAAVPVWENDGAGPGYLSMSMASLDGSRQAIAVVNVYDLDVEVHGGVPIIPSSGAIDVMRAALC